MASEVTLPESWDLCKVGGLAYDDETMELFAIDEVKSTLLTGKLERHDEELSIGNIFETFLLDNCRNIIFLVDASVVKTFEGKLRGLAKSLDLEGNKTLWVTEEEDQMVP